MSSGSSPDRDAVGRFWPLVAVSIGALVVLAVLYLRIRQLCGGTLVYGLDDAYIHLAIAANLVEHGSWGVNAGEFSSTSSSLLWPLVLAAARAVGLGEHGPMVVSVALVAVILVRADVLLARRAEQPPWVRAAVLGLLFVVTPMPELVFNGMEHLLHVWLTIELLDRAGRVLAGLDPVAESRRVTRRDTVVLMVLAVLLTSVRYEAAFQVAVLSGLLALRRSWGLAAGVAIAGAAPIVSYGAMASAQGWPFLPTGLLLKTALLEETTIDALRRMINEFAAKIPGALPIVALISAGLLVQAYRAPAKAAGERADQYAMLLFALSAIPHLILANLGNLFRYEAYLYAGGLFAAAVPAWRLIESMWTKLRGATGRSWRVALVLIALGLPGFTLVQRGGAALLAVPLTSRDIHGQQIQMARFVQQYFPSGPVAINDIGTISYYTDAPIVDIVGLATREVAEFHFSHDDFTGKIGEFAASQGVRIAMVYEPWLGDPPPGWIEAATWTVEERIVLGWPTVTFYAVDPAAYDDLMAALYAYVAELPAGVEFELPDAD